MKVTDANKTNMEELKLKKANDIRTPELKPSTVSVNTASGKTLYIDIVDEPFDPENVIVMTTFNPAEQSVNEQSEVKGATPSHISQDSGYQSASSSSSYGETYLGEWSHSKSNQLIENINKQIGYLERIIVNKDDINLSSDLSNSPNEKIDNRHRRGPKPICLNEIDSEEKKKNIKKCRKYRSDKKVLETKEMTELDILEEKNNKLMLNENILREKVRRSKHMYIKLIKAGRIRFG